MDIGHEVRRYRAEPLVSPVPGAAPPVEEPAHELPTREAPVGEHEPARPDVEVVPSA